MSLQTTCAQVRAAVALLISGFVSENTLALEASCRVAFATAKGKKPHAIGEGLMNPYTIDVIENRTKRKVKKIYLSNHRVRCRISVVL